MPDVCEFDREVVAALARALANKRGFNLPDDFENSMPKSKVGQAVADARTCLEALRELQLHQDEDRTSAPTP